MALDGLLRNKLSKVSTSLDVYKCSFADRLAMTINLLLYAELYELDF